MDEVEIANLVYRCAALMDQGDLERAAELFAGGGVQWTESGEWLSGADLVSAWQSELSAGGSELPSVQQVITNPMISVDREQARASCESCYSVLQSNGAAALQVVGAGRYLDEFVRSEGSWQFASRRRRVLSAGVPAVRAEAGVGQSEREAAAMSPVKAKILAAAQQTFSSVGYSDAGMRKIAELAGLSPTILFRHFGNKAALFEAALIAAMGEPKQPHRREEFGRHVASLLADPTQINCPHAMTVLATGNEEAREIAIRVLREYAILPMIQWLGTPHAESRAREIMALCAGFALYNVQLNITASTRVDTHMVDWLARSIQALVDEGWQQPEDELSRQASLQKG